MSEKIIIYLTKEELAQCLKQGILKEVKPRKKLTKKEK